MIEDESLKNFQVVYPDARVFSDGGIDFIYIPKLILPRENTPSEVEALLCPQTRDGYTTRLFLSNPIIGKGANWSQHVILGRSWHACSWQNVQANQSLAQILLGHLAVFR